MDRLIYIAMTGAKHTLEQQAVLAHNMANASTNGYKAELSAFRALPVVGEGAKTRAFVVDSTLGADFTPGPLQQTGRELDIAVQGKGWIAVQGLDGREAYTRDGNLQMTANGVLQTRNGLNVLGDGGPITIPPNTRVTIGGDGTVSTVPTDAAPSDVVIVGRIKLVNPSETTLVKSADGLFRQTNGLPAPADTNVQLVSGELEGSNVSMVESLVSMISHARQFETQIKLLQIAETDSRGWSQILNMSA